jgi:hypothetical protein
MLLEHYRFGICLGCGVMLIQSSFLFGSDLTDSSSMPTVLVAILDEIDPPDLREYPSLGAFFCRKLKDGVRPIDPAILVRFCSQLTTITADHASLGEPSRWDGTTLWHCRRFQGRTSQRHYVFSRRSIRCRKTRLSIIRLSSGIQKCRWLTTKSLLS